MFSRIASYITAFTGSSKAFIMAVMLVIVWASVGPMFHWSEMHSLVINTVTTIITFLMVFLIQNSQNKDTRALHLKMDELIRANRRANNALRGIENLEESEVNKIKSELDESTNKI